jgi:Cysteine rich repeat
MYTPMLLIIMCIAAAAGSASADEPATPAPAPAPSQQAIKDVRAACEADAKKLCAGVQPGGGRILQCLGQHKTEVSDACKQAVMKAKQAAP